MTTFTFHVTAKRMRQFLLGLNGSRTFLITKRDDTGRIYIESIDIMKLPPGRWDFPGTPEAVGHFSLLRDLKRINCMKECCAGMELALSRVRTKDRLGLMREQLLVFKTGEFIYKLILRVHTGPGSKAPGAWIELNFCPFCGKRVNGDGRKKPATTRLAGSPATQPKGDNTTYRAGRKGKATVKRDGGGHVPGTRQVRDDG